MTRAVTDQLLSNIQQTRAARATQEGRGSKGHALTPQQTVEVIEAFDAKQPRRDIATKYHISLATIFRIASL